jgi:hypothetical protein
VHRLPFILLVLITGTDAHAQGSVNFSNQSTALSSPPDRLVRFDPVTVGTNAPNPFGTNDAPVVGTNFVAQLFFGASTASEDSLAPVSTAPATFRTVTTASPGTWFNGNRTIEGFQGGDTVNLQVRVWDITHASSWAQYLAAPQGLAGKSLLFLYTLPSGYVPPIGLDNMQNFQGFYIFNVPEPSGFSLCALGIVVLWLHCSERCYRRIL